MGEYFEITFFEASPNSAPETSTRLKSALNMKDGLNHIANSKFKILQDRCVYYQCYEEAQFDMYQFSLENLIFYKRTFDADLDNMMQVISACFDAAPNLRFATGIYELTDYYLGEAATFEAAMKKAILNFPLLFFRASNAPPTDGASKLSHQVKCIMQSGTAIQDLFTD